MAAPDANVVVDTTDVFERKLAALMSHQSQVGEESDIRKLLTQLVGLGRRRRRPARGPDGRELPGAPAPAENPARPGPPAGR